MSIQFTVEKTSIIRSDSVSFLQVEMVVRTRIDPKDIPTILKTCEPGKLIDLEVYEEEVKS